MKKKIITITFLAVAITASLIPSVMFFYCKINLYGLVQIDSFVIGAVLFSSFMNTQDVYK